MTWVVGRCRYACRSRGGCGQVCMRAGLGVGVGKFRQIWARLGKGGQVWMGQTDRAGMVDMDSR